MATRAYDPAPGRSPVETALRHLGARRYGTAAETIEYAILRPQGRTGTVLAPLTDATSGLAGWSPAERAGALWRVIEEGVGQISSTGESRRRRALQAAFRMTDDEVGWEWGASLTERFKQLRRLRLFADATSTQPMEVSWKRGVEQLAFHLERRLDELRASGDWTPYRRSEPGPAAARNTRATFREPSEGAQKLVLGLYVMTVLMRGKVEFRRISERVLVSRDEAGLKYYTARAFTSASVLQGRTYVPTRAVWGCREEHVEEDGMEVTRLWFPRPLTTGEQAHFVSEAEYGVAEDDDRGWANVDIDHYGIEAGELHGGFLPVRGLTIRIRFDDAALPKAVWWYAEQNERERYREPPAGSPRRLPMVCGEVVKTFGRPCQPRESYGIAYSW